MQRFFRHCIPYVYLAVCLGGATGCRTDVFIAGKIVPDTTSDDTASTDTETTTDSSSSDTSTETGMPTEAESDTPQPCPTLPAGADAIAATDAPGFEAFGEATFQWNTLSGAEVPAAWHIETQTITATTAGTQMLHPLTSDIRVGDHMVAEFWARCDASAAGAAGLCHLGALVEEAQSPWTNLVAYFTMVGSEWQFFQVPFVVHTPFAANQVHLTFRLGYSNQTVEIYPARLINYGVLAAEDRVDCLPNTTALLTDLAFLGTAPSTAYAGILYEYFAEVNGVPSATVTAATLPAWLTFDPDRRLLSGIPGYDDVGTNDVTLVAENANGSVSQQFQIEVLVDPTLVGHWPLDETSGTIAEDVSGNERHGIVIGDPVWQPTDGQIGGSLYCNSYVGDMDYVLLPSDPVMDNIQFGPYTLAAWARPESIPPGKAVPDNDFGYGILIKPSPNTGMWYDSSQFFSASHHFEGSASNLFAPLIPPGEFHHIAAVMNPDAKRYTLYIDGEQSTSIAISGGETNVNFGSKQWHIGLADPDVDTHKWLGDISIDNVRMYSRALNITEIRSLAGVR